MSKQKQYKNDKQRARQSDKGDIDGLAPRKMLGKQARMNWGTGTGRLNRRDIDRAMREFGEE